MQAVSDRISPPALRRLQLRMRPMLRTAGGNHQTRQGQGSSDVGRSSALQAQPIQSRDSWFAERERFGTPLSLEELQHGVAVGIISESLLR